MKPAFLVSIAITLGTSAFYCSSVTTAAEAPNLASYQGAWLEQSMQCHEVYVSRRNAMAFRKNVNLFAPAILISGKRLATPGAVCHIRSVSGAKDRQTFRLGCATSITVTPITAYISSRDGALYRYTDESDRVGSRYERCLPQH